MYGGSIVGHPGSIERIRPFPLTSGQSRRRYPLWPDVRVIPSRSGRPIRSSKFALRHSLIPRSRFLFFGSCCSMTSAAVGLSRDHPFFVPRSDWRWLRMPFVAKTSSGIVSTLDPDPASRRHDLVWKVLSSALGADAFKERRADFRYPYPRLIHLVSADAPRRADEGIVVVGKTLSQGGLGFYHPKPFHWKRVIASLEDEPGNWVGLLVNIAWCRFTRLGWYESGGSVLAVVDSPLATSHGDVPSKH